MNDRELVDAIRGYRRHQLTIEQKAKLGRMNLSSMTLKGIDLSEANLNDTILQDANLRMANFSRASLCRANLSGATLNGANLSGASLSGANLKGTDLTRADLRGIDLTRAICNGVNFNRADLSGARLSDSVFVRCKLVDVIGMEEVRHYSPSVVDHTTIRRSGLLPNEFLRGCGLEEWQIEEMKLLEPNLTEGEIIDIGYEVIRLRGEHPIQFFSPFISYSSKDERFSEKLYTYLQGEGVRCWYAPEDMKIGDKIRNRIDEAIHVNDKLLLILSENSVSSDWVEKEVETAFEKERETNQSVLFPIRIDDAVETVNAGWAADIRRSRHIGDFRNWKDDDAFKAGVQRIIRDLRA